jgi:CheY-like chemotaxis protein
MLHALIIEDELLIAMELEMHVMSLGFASSEIVFSERDAVASARRRHPDLITADFHLAQGTGLAAVRTIRHLLGAIPVVFVTGHATLLDGVADPVVDKPFTQAGLCRACKIAFERSKKADAFAYAQVAC